MLKATNQHKLNLLMLAVSSDRFGRTAEAKRLGCHIAETMDQLQDLTRLQERTGVVEFKSTLTQGV